jgi:hypothetical protein
VLRQKSCMARPGLATRYEVPWRRYARTIIHGILLPWYQSSVRRRACGSSETR